MRRLLSTIIFLTTVLPSAFSQARPKAALAGWWVNMQYEDLKNKPHAKELLYYISPWFINVEPSGKCTVIWMYEQKTELGYPKEKKFLYGGVWKYHYRKYKDTWLHSVAGHDSLMVYSLFDTPAAGILFKRYNQPGSSLP